MNRKMKKEVAAGHYPEEPAIPIRKRDIEDQPLTLDTEAVVEDSGKDIEASDTDKGICATQNDEEDWKLLPDTFTLLMTAEYPERCCGCIWRFIWSYLCCCWICSSSPQVEHENNITRECASRGIDNKHDESEIMKAERLKTDRKDPDYCYFPFWVGSLVFFGQMFIYGVVILDLLYNKEIPPNVDRWLRLAQIFAVLVSTYTQSDLIDGVFLLYEGPNKFSDITKPWKFRLSCYLRVLSGMVGVLGTFMLIIYSIEVVELLLNFTAMEFVATLDDSAFMIASKGFFGPALAKKTASISKYRYSTNPASSLESRHRWYAGGVVLVFALFGLVWGLQSGRQFGDNEVYVQFDDTGVPELFGISGVYKGCDIGQNTRIGPIVYIPISNKCPSLYGWPPGAFWYCWKRHGWIYNQDGDRDACNPQSKSEPLLRSSKDREESFDSDAYNLLTHDDADWIFRRPSNMGGEVVLDEVVMHSVDKYKDVFKNNSCEIIESQGIHTNERLDYSMFDSHRDVEKFGEKFGLMYRPIFHRPLEGQNGKFQVLLYYGLRWLYIDLDLLSFHAAYASREHDVANTVCSGSVCWEPFVKYFLSDHSWLYNRKIANVTAISDPMTLLTPSDTGRPTSDLQWYKAEVKTAEDGMMYLQPGRPLPDVSKNSSLNGYFFQCSNHREDNSCIQGYTDISMRVKTDQYPEDTTILTFLGQGIAEYNSSLLDEKVDSILAHGGHKSLPDLWADDNRALEIHFSDSESQHDLTTCVPSDACIQLVILDEFRDGFLPPAGGKYEFYYNNTLEVSYVSDHDQEDYISSSWHCRSYQIGNSCWKYNPNRPSPASCDFTIDSNGNLLIWNT